MLTTASVGVSCWPTTTFPKPVSKSSDGEGMEVAVMPAHRRLDRLVQVAKRHRAGHDQPAPDRRLGAAQRHLQSDDVLAGFGLGCAGHDLPILSASDIGEDVSTALLCGMPLPMAKRW